MSQTQFKKTSGVILVYSVTARRTFDSLSKLLDDIRAVVDSSTCFMLIANNYSQQQRIVTSEEGMKFAKMNKLQLFREIEGTSASSIV
jgi:GTPase SAR1 family protein